MRRDDVFFAHPDVRDGLVGEWELGENLASPVIDLSGNGNNGVITGASRVDGLGGHKVLDFDGIDDKVIIANDSVLNITDKISAVLLLKLDAWSSYKRILNKYAFDYTLVPYEIGGDNTGDYIYFGVATDVGRKTVQLAVDSGKWYFVVGTYNGVTININVNNASETSDAHSGNIITNNNDLHIAERNAAFFEGQIAMSRIYNRALSVDEISALYKFIYKKYGLKPDHLISQ